MERRPLRSNRSIIHAGAGREISTSSMTRPKYFGQAEGALISMGKTVSVETGTSLATGSLTDNRLQTATSRAMPRILKQSPRFGVRSNSIATSSKPNASRNSDPGVRESASSMIPSCSSLTPNSLALQSIPSDLIPLNFVGFIFKPPESSEPTLANAVLRPTRAFGAPQTTLYFSEPSNTVQTERRSAFG